MILPDFVVLGTHLCSNIEDLTCWWQRIDGGMKKRQFQIWWIFPQIGMNVTVTSKLSLVSRLGWAVLCVLWVQGCNWECWVLKYFTKNWGEDGKQTKLSKINFSSMLKNQYLKSIAIFNYNYKQSLTIKIIFNNLINSCLSVGKIFPKQFHLWCLGLSRTSHAHDDEFAVQPSHSLQLWTWISFFIFTENSPFSKLFISLIKGILFLSFHSMDYLAAV